MSRLARSSVISCNKDTTTSNLCHACQLGRHVRLPFPRSQSRASRPFDLVHCDLWTSPLSSVSGFKYYLVILDDYSHHVWTFPLRLKSNTFSTIAHFFAYVATQFGCTIKSMQCDNGREFDNSSTRAFFLTHGVHLRMSCPIPRSKMVKLSVFFALSIISFAPSFFRHTFPLPIGLRLFPLPLTS